MDSGELRTPFPTRSSCKQATPTCGPLTSSSTSLPISASVRSFTEPILFLSDVGKNKIPSVRRGIQHLYLTEIFTTYRWRYQMARSFHSIFLPDLSGFRGEEKLPVAIELFTLRLKTRRPHTSDFTDVNPPQLHLVCQ
ncbi:unnamed protein product [Victoria cruziana]